MPIRMLANLLKPRNIRAFVFILVFATLLFALYQLLLGSQSESFPTKFVPIEEHFDGRNQLVSEDDFYHQNNVIPSNNLEVVTLTNNNGEGAGGINAIIPRYNGVFVNASWKYDGERQAGRCPKIQIFKPDFDVADVYPNLDFDADWIRGREYWNTFFEQRYKEIKSSKASPPLKVFVVPHSHNDPGWLLTYEEYYNQQTRHILDNAMEKLTEFKSMSFLWSEISFLSKWWTDSHPRKRTLLRNLIREGRFEIVTGGWVMTDEATVNLYSMIDQLIEGQQWVKARFNISPKSSWSVDPFGHGSVFPYILKQSGVTGMVIQRIHYAWKKWLSENQKSDFQWVQRWDYSNKNSILCHNAPFDIYSIKHSCGPHPQICLNFDFKSINGEYAENSMIMQPITKLNVQEKAELMLEQYGRTASLFSHNVAMISMGDDFRFTKPIEWDQQYHNYMKLFAYINSNKDRYNADVQFGTVSDYFKAVQERQSDFPTFSGDFHVYSDIFSEGRPAYWSGYYGTRPYWKKFYRETENNIRGAEILFTFANALAIQKNLNNSRLILNHSYEELTTARRWLALFAHHDATTGTSKAHTMADYGAKLLEAYQFSTKTQINAIETILFGSADSDKLTTDYEIDGFGELPRQIPISFDSPSGIKKIVLYNNLGRRRFHLMKMVVETPHVQVVDPNGEFVESQLNPVLDMTDPNTMVLSDDIFELTFLADLMPLSLSIFEIRKSQPNAASNAVRAIIYCKSCISPQKLFEVNNVQAGDIQLNNDKLQVLFDRNTGLLMSITKTKEKISTNVNMKFGSYASVYFRSGAYLLMPDVQSEQSIPFANQAAKLIIVSGPISSELSVFHEPLLLSTRIMHSGDSRMLEAIYLQNTIDVGQHNGEIYMRFDTDLKTTVKVKAPPKFSNANENNETPEAVDPNLNNNLNNLAKDKVVDQNPLQEDPTHEPVFYTDQSGFTVEKRVRIPSIKYEGNTYPVNTMAFIQDEGRKMRFSILVDRSHGFTSMENGRLETLVERRTVYDDSRGMGEGVTDNVNTISNYIILLEKLGPTDKVRHTEGNYRNSQPTLSSHHFVQDLSYPSFFYVMKEWTPTSTPTSATGDIIPLLNQELPCDSHLLNLRTITDSSYHQELNFPSGKALLLVQKLGYLCIPPDEKPGCGNPNPLSLFYPSTSFNGVEVKSIAHSDLAGVNLKPKGILKQLHDIVSEPFEISSVIVTFA